MFKRKELAEIPNVKPIAAETKKQRAKEGKQRSKQLRRSAKQSEMNAAQSARSIKKRRAPEKAADCLQYERMYESGICEVEPGLFSMTMAFTDVNFQLARQEEQKSLFTQYSEFLNYFDPDTHLQISLVTRRVDAAEFRRDTFLPLRGDARDRYSEEMNRVISEKALQLFTQTNKQKRLFRTEEDIVANIQTQFGMPHTGKDLLLDAKMSGTTSTSVFCANRIADVQTLVQKINDYRNAAVTEGIYQAFQNDVDPNGNPYGYDSLTGQRSNNLQHGVTWNYANGIYNDTAEIISLATVYYQQDWPRSELVSAFSDNVPFTKFCRALAAYGLDVTARESAPYSCMSYGGCVNGYRSKGEVVSVKDYRLETHTCSEGDDACGQYDAAAEWHWNEGHAENESYTVWKEDGTHDVTVFFPIIFPDGATGSELSDLPEEYNAVADGKIKAADCTGNIVLDDSANLYKGELNDWFYTPDELTVTFTVVTGEGDDAVSDDYEVTFSNATAIPWCPGELNDGQYGHYDLDCTIYLTGYDRYTDPETQAPNGADGGTGNLEALAESCDAGTLTRTIIKQDQYGNEYAGNAVSARYTKTITLPNGASGFQGWYKDGEDAYGNVEWALLLYRMDWEELYDIVDGIKCRATGSGMTEEELRQLFDSLNIDATTARGQVVDFALAFLCFATKVYAEDVATVTVTVANFPQKLQNRTVIVTLGNGPSDTESTVIVLDGLNNYTETVTVVPSEYYCAAAVQYDALGDYPLQEIDQTTFLQVEDGNHYDLIYTLADSSWYESVTGQQRHYTLQPLETPPENYEPKPAQVGAYLTAPVGFSQHVIVYLQNLYTDDVYDLELYESNELAAVEPNALSGKYAFLSAYVVGDAENRYQFNCEQNELSTETGADFHLTVTDTANPDREMNTPSRDQNSTVQAANSFNNKNTDAPQQSTVEPKTVSQPVKQIEKQLDLLSLLLDFMPVVLVGAVLFAVRCKHRR